jgi:hypothetical protein
MPSSLDDVIVFSLGWTIFMIDISEKNYNRFCNIIDTINFIEDHYYSIEVDFELLNNQIENG